MSVIDKMPRWALIVVLLVLLKGADLIIPTFFQNQQKKDEAYATEISSIKGVAYQAKNSGERAEAGVSRLEGQIAEIRSAQETFRVEYRQDRQRSEDKREEDQRELLRKLEQINKKV